MPAVSFFVRIYLERKAESQRKKRKRAPKKSQKRKRKKKGNKSQKKSHIEQWKAVTSAFSQESKKVFGRSSIFRYKLADRLAQKVEQTETVRDDYIQSIRAFDRLKTEIIQLTRKITAAEDENQADSNIPKLIERSAADLSTKVSNAYAEISTKRSPKDFDALVKDLRYYAGKRSEW